MRNIILVDGAQWYDLLPLTSTRPISQIRCGIWTLWEKWAYYFGTSIHFCSVPYLNRKFQYQLKEDNLLINSAILPEDNLVQELKELGPGESAKRGDLWLASRLDLSATKRFLSDFNKERTKGVPGEDISIIQFPEDILQYNDRQLRLDLSRIRTLRSSATLDRGIYHRGDDIFIEEGAKIHQVTINAEKGPVYIGRQSVILDGCHIMGPFALGDHSILKMGAKIYGSTSTGPHCKLGGEVKNSMFFGYSSKSHDGYIGDSVVGEWCNFGAGSSTSNMKNTYGLISLFHPYSNTMRRTNNQFLGVIMGDHSKCAINTSFSTGTVIGVFANIFDYNPKQSVRSFSWGKDATYDYDKALEVADRAMGRKGLSLTVDDKEMLKSLYDKR